MNLVPYIGYLQHPPVLPRVGVFVFRFFFFTCFLINVIAAPAQQCTLPSRIFLPQADTQLIEQLGRSIDVDGAYMVAGLDENCDQQVYSGKVIVYKLNAQHQWESIAELFPSNPGKSRSFGEEVYIAGNTIVVRGIEYNDAGESRANLYVFEKSPAGEWVTSTESYIITKPFIPYPNNAGFGRCALTPDELIILARENRINQIEIYRHTAGTFTRAQTIPMPTDRRGTSSLEYTIATGDNFFALGSDQFDNADGSNGVVMTFEKTGINYSTTPARLEAAEQSSGSWRAFGQNIVAHGSTLFIQGLKETGGTYKRVFYITSKPVGGWGTGKLSEMLEADGYVWSYSQLEANENYFFSVASDFKQLTAFKKNGSTWSSTAIPFTVDDLPADQYLFGYQIELNDQHLVIGCVNRNVDSGMREEFIFDYYSETGEWEHRDMSKTQELRHTAVNATDDFFGERLAVYNGQLAVSAEGDDEKGLNTGAVYLFDMENPANTPRQRIFHPGGENYSGFGQSLAMGDSVMFIGAPYQDSITSTGTKIWNVGKVFIYRLTGSGWQYSSNIIPPTVNSEVHFGRNVVWTPGYCAVTEFYGGSSEDIGRVHIYKENKTNGRFEYIATLDPKVHLRSDYFGKSMVMNDSMMVIGTGYIAPNSSYRQSAYVFMKKGEWESTTEDAKLGASDSGWSDRFGASVSTYGDYIVIGAPYSPGYDPRPIPRDYPIHGAAYIFKRPKYGWKGELNEIAKLTPDDPTDFGLFGSAVAIDHNDIFIGAPSNVDTYNYTDKFTNNDNTLIPGSVYHFVKQGKEWVSTSTAARKMQSFEPEIVDGYGACLYVSDRVLLVGAALDDTEKGFRTGSVQTMRQLPAFDNPTLCVDEAPRKLLGFPKGGLWSGTGVNNATGMFDPRAAGPGTHMITYEFQGCQTTMPIEVMPNILTITRQSNAVQTKCINQQIAVVFESNVDAENYMWYFGTTSSGPFTKTDSMKQIVRVAKPGFYKVVLSRGPCQSHVQTFEIREDMAVDIQIDPVPLICGATPVVLNAQPSSGTWTGPGISSSGVLDPLQSGNGTHKERYTLTTPEGCVWKDSINVIVDVLPEPVMQYNGDPICGDDVVTLTVDNVAWPTIIQWYRDGSQIWGANTTTYTTRVGGNYMVRVTKGTCSFDTQPADVKQEDDNIWFDIPLICSDAEIDLTVSPLGGTWSGPAVTTAGRLNPALLNNGLYAEVYTLVTPIGCTWQKTAYVAVDKLLHPTLSTNMETVCRDEPATLTLGSIADWSTIAWQSDKNLDLPDNHQSIETDVPATYWATVSKSYCTLSTEQITLVATPHNLFVPNVFTANGDGANEYFQVSGEGLDSFQMSVYNRYGQLVYETDDFYFRWAGENVSPGIYFWRATYRSCADTREALNGWVQFIR